MRIAIVGAGAMGCWLADFSKRNLGEVVITDIDRAKANSVAKDLNVNSKPITEAVAKTDIVFVAVPISETPKVVKSLAGKVQRRVLIADVASVKREVVETMRRIDADLELVSLHPLFGPGATNVRGKDFVVVPVKPGERYAWLRKRLEELGAKIIELGVEEHDRLMAVIQCMTHFVLLAYLRTLKSMKGLELAKRFRTPMFVSLVDLAKSVLAGNPKLYGELQAYNKYAWMMRSSFLETCRSLDIALTARDMKSIEAIFDEALISWKMRDVKEAYRKLYERFESEQA